MASRDHEQGGHVETDPTQEPQSKAPKAPRFWLFAKICVAEYEIQTMAAKTIQELVDPEYIKYGDRCTRYALCYDVMTQQQTHCGNCGGKDKHEPACVKLFGGQDPNYRCACIG